MGFFKTLFTGKEDTPEEKAQEKQRNDFDMFKYDGIQALRMRQTDFAIACFNHALDIHDDAETRQNLVNAYMSKDDIDNAIDQLEHLVGLLPDNPAFAISLAELQYQHELYEEAQQTCNEAIEHFDTLAQPHHIMAKIHHAHGNLIEAVAEATIAISKQDDFAEAYLLRAAILAKMGQYAEAETDADKVLTIMPDSDEALTIKAQCCIATGRADEAEQTYRQIIGINPFHADAYISLGQLLMQQGRTEEATRLAEEALQNVPEQMEGINGNFSNKE